VADILLENPEVTLLNSASDLAQMAKVSNSTVTRFVKNLGFETYDAMRRKMRSQFGQGSPLSLVKQPGAQSSSDMITRFAQQEAEILEGTFAHLDREILDQAAEALIKAPQIGFLGMRNSHFFASYAHWQFVQFRPGTRLISGAGETSAEHLAGFKKGDLVVIVGVRRIVGKLRACIDILSDADVEILLIADASSLHLAQRARWTIVCPVENEHVFDSYSGVLGVLRLLAFTALQKAGKDGLAYMASIEDHHHRLNEL
jgi:DNA-binding MurR/RpiR family transcriptional regulator